MKSHPEIIQHKLQKAKGLMLEVEPLMALGFYTTVISRLYYSCFHATKALLLTKSIAPKTHSGVATMLHHHFVNTNEFDKDKGAFFGHLLQERIQDDYGDFLILDKDEVIPFIQPAKDYVLYVEQLIADYLKMNPQILNP